MKSVKIDNAFSQPHSWNQLAKRHDFFLPIETFVQTQFSLIPDQWQAERYIRASVGGRSKEPSSFKRKRQTCEGAQPVSLMKVDIPKLYYGHLTYLMTAKTKGTHYQCGFLMIQSEPILFFRQPQTKAIYVIAAQEVPDGLFQGTLLDGELVYIDATSKWEYHIFGILTCAGKSVALSPLLQRLSWIQSILESWKMPDTAESRHVVFPNHCPIGFHMKPWFALNEIKKMQTYILSANYPIDGGILIPMEYPEVNGTFVLLKKIKLNELCNDNVSAANQNTIDFRAEVMKWPLQDTNTKIECKTQDKMVDGEECIALCTRKGVFSYMKLPKEDVDKKIIEVAWKNGVWCLETIRINKMEPNDHATVLKTMQNIQENLHLEDVFPYSFVTS